MLPDNTTLIEKILRNALEEDIGSGDITTSATISENKHCSAVFVAREPLVFCGFSVLEILFSLLSKKCILTSLLNEGEKADTGQEMIHIEGPARAILTGERVALNVLQRMCGVATLTACYVEQVKGTNAVILDTRKTMPGLRILDKYAVRCGGGRNHRTGLYDAIMIKDNHIALCGGVKEAANKVLASNENKKLLTEVECDTLEQVKEALECDIERILLDNMSTDQLRQAVVLSDGKILLEASGNVTLETVRKIAETGVDYISVGCLTHSAPAADIGLDITLDGRN